MTIFIDVGGLDAFRQTMELAPKISMRAARLAINDTVEKRGLKLARDAMLAQVAFPRGYLNEADKTGRARFGVLYKATDARLTAGIVARQEGTQLSRFSPDRTGFVSRGRRPQGVRVQIEPGRESLLKRAFFVRLRSGNIGLGIRLRNGEQMTNTQGAKLITKGPLAGVALLYGPSVDQVFATVAVDISQPMMQYLTFEYFRQFERLFRDANFQAT